jgi:hypothetical protein
MSLLIALLLTFRSEFTLGLDQVINNVSGPEFKNR